MKVLLTTLNAKYVHSNLALRYLRSALIEHEVTLQEYTINDRIEQIAAEIFRVGAKLIGFSCYIWNVSIILQLVEILHRVSPETTIVLGGPEVSYDPGEYIEQYPGVDYLVYGEGEQTFRELLNCLSTESTELSSIKGLAYRDLAGYPQVTPARSLEQNLANLPEPYLQLDGLENRIAYIESSRGCPFSCQYCLSSTISGVRFSPFERTKAELKRLVEAGVKQVKFVDRTFNCDKTHALEIMNFIAEWNPDANFHFEISADLLNQEMIEYLTTVPKGLFQFEVGVQSTNPKTLELIERRSKMTSLEENVKAVASTGNIRLFLDLIAGLPGEDFNSFTASFNEVYSWQPAKIHLGFLKLLKGSGIRRRAEEWDYKYTPFPPYIVLSNQWLSHTELLKLHALEDMVEKYYNTGRFTHTLDYLTKRWDAGAFACLAALADFWQQKYYHRQALNAKAHYDILYDFYKDNYPEPEAQFSELLKLDYLLWNKPTHIPAWFSSSPMPGFKERADSFLRRGLPELMPQLRNISIREINKHFHLEPFPSEMAQYLNLGSLPSIAEPLCLLFYYPGQLIKSEKPGFIPVVV